MRAAVDVEYGDRPHRQGGTRSGTAPSAVGVDALRTTRTSDRRILCMDMTNLQPVLYWYGLPCFGVGQWAVSHTIYMYMYM